MIDLPATYVRHLVQPKGLGDLEGAHATGECGSMVGGRGVRITLIWRSAPEQGSVIDAARGRVFGTPALRAPVSWLSEALQGRDYEAASAVTEDVVLAALSEGRPERLPEPVVHGAGLVVGALQRALGIAEEGAPSDPNGRGLLVCRCIGVGDRPIRAAIRAGALDPEALGEATGACLGCRSCRPDLMALIDEEIHGPAPVSPPAAGVLEQITWACVGPALRGLGLPLARVEVAGDVVRLGFGPPRAWACVSPVGAVAVARQILRDTASEAVRVEAAPA